MKSQWPCQFFNSFATKSPKSHIHCDQNHDLDWQDIGILISHWQIGIYSVGESKENKNNTREKPCQI